MAKFKKFFFITLAVLLGLGGVAGWFSYSANFSEGNRTGRILKMSRKGVLIKTNEGQLNQEIITSPAVGGSGPSNIWDFSVEDSQAEALRKIDEAMRDNKRVTLHYEEKFVRFFWRGDTKYLITKVDVIE
ncbi:MAG: hypothetical protein MUC97_08000 [Bernardetiaceae bacterium]|jgi:hypothetical protein|nr:hypothetical protein [Bernardetiaceae bacterium]